VGGYANVIWLIRRIVVVVICCDAAEFDAGVHYRVSLVR
jgi:hypothetical protein